MFFIFKYYSDNSGKSSNKNKHKYYIYADDFWTRVSILHHMSSFGPSSITEWQQSVKIFPFLYGSNISMVTWPRNTQSGIADPVAYIQR